MKHTPTPWRKGYRGIDIGCENAKIGGVAKLLDVRGWGYLTGTGHGALGLSFDEAVAAQTEFTDFVVTAVNAYDKHRALIETLTKTLASVKTWAEQRCPCHEETPNPCPLCGASVENLEACKAVDQTFPRDIKRDIFAALAAAKEATL
jgi:hypothetical protein